MKPKAPGAQTHKFSGRRRGSELAACRERRVSIKLDKPVPLRLPGCHHAIKRQPVDSQPAWQLLPVSKSDRVTAAVRALVSRARPSKATPVGFKTLTSISEGNRFDSGL